MTTVNMLKAKSTLSRLVEAVESGAETEIIIARNGKPAARLVPLEAATTRRPKRLGMYAGKFPPLSVEDFAADDAYIAALFNGDTE